MAGKLFILSDVADFAPGFFEDTVVEGGCVQLVREDGGYPMVGSYTSPPFDAEDFFSLTPSWNADAPPKTGVEVQVRVAADGRWSRWFTFGVWSPYLHSASPSPQRDDTAGVQGDILTLAEGSPAADVVQLRVFLYSEDPQKTPLVWLLGVATNAAQKMDTEPRAFDRMLEVPAYSCQTRDPAIAPKIASVTALTMMMNRWGRDLLPEEVARTAYDAGLDSYRNMSFLSAAGGTYGFRCYVAFAGIATLRRQVWDGRSVGARVNYRAPALPGMDEADVVEGRPLPPVLEGATTTSYGHMVVVHGFTRQDGRDMVRMHDPLALSDEAVSMEVPLSVFAKIYTGLALFLEIAPKGAGAESPQRAVAELVLKDGAIGMRQDEAVLVPDALEGEMLPATVCYTLSDGIAYASQAQRPFYYPGRDEEGRFKFEADGIAGRRLTLYLIGSCGQLFVAERQLGDENESLPVLHPPLKTEQEDPHDF